MKEISPLSNIEKNDKAKILGDNMLEAEGITIDRGGEANYAPSNVSLSSQACTIESLSTSLK